MSVSRALIVRQGPGKCLRRGFVSECLEVPWGTPVIVNMPNDLRGLLGRSTHKGRENTGA